VGYGPVHDSEHVAYRLPTPAQGQVGGRSQRVTNRRLLKDIIKRMLDVGDH